MGGVGERGSRFPITLLSGDEGRLLKTYNVALLCFIFRNQFLKNFWYVFRIHPKQRRTSEQRSPAAKVILTAESMNLLLLLAQK